MHDVHGLVLLLRCRVRLIYQAACGPPAYFLPLQLIPSAQCRSRFQYVLECQSLSSRLALKALQTLRYLAMLWLYAHPQRVARQCLFSRVDCCALAAVPLRCTIQRTRYYSVFMLIGSGEVRMFGPGSCTADGFMHVKCIKRFLTNHPKQFSGSVVCVHVCACVCMCVCVCVGGVFEQVWVRAYSKE